MMAFYPENDSWTASGHEMSPTGGDVTRHCKRCDGLFMDSAAYHDHECEGDK